jgi:hypothetical protein
MVTLCGEKFFCGESSVFQFASETLFMVLYGVLGSVYSHFVVCICIVCCAF